MCRYFRSLVDRLHTDTCRMLSAACEFFNRADIVTCVGATQWAQLCEVWLCNGTCLMLIEACNFSVQLQIADSFIIVTFFRRIVLGHHWGLVVQWYLPYACWGLQFFRTLAKSRFIYNNDIFPRHCSWTPLTYMSSIVLWRYCNNKERTSKKYSFKRG